MSEEENDPVIIPNFEGIPITLTPEQQGELQKRLNAAWKEFVAGLPDGLLVLREFETRFSVTDSEGSMDYPSIEDETFPPGSGMPYDGMKGTCTTCGNQIEYSHMSSFKGWFHSDLKDSDHPAKFGGPA